MSVGAGIIWATLIILLAVAVWRTTVNKKWKTVGKVFGWIVGAGVLVGAGIWGWSEYQDRPQIVTELAGVKLGMSPLDVTLAIGEPKEKSDVERDEEDKDEERMSYTYGKTYDDEYVLNVVFYRKGNEEFGAAIICEFHGDERLLGFSRWSTESGVTEKLGEPGVVSVRKDGLAKIVSYPQWKAAFFVEKSSIVGICATQSGKIGYTDEHSETPEASP